MGILNKLFGSQNTHAQPKQEAWIVDSTTEQEGNGLTRNECRACTGGNGEGICEYHANMFRRSGQRYDHVQRNRPRY